MLRGGLGTHVVVSITLFGRNLPLSPIKSCATISLVEQAKGGPFVFWDDFDTSCCEAAALGFDAVELFAPNPEAIAIAEVKDIVAKHGIALAAVGTGAGMVIDALSLSDPDDEARARACNFVRSMIWYGAEAGVPAIIGSMQGKVAERESGLNRLAESLIELDAVAQEAAVPLLLEPLNRYETNLVNTLSDAMGLIERCGTKNLRIMADLFHMNIEETNIAQSLREAKDSIGHIHFADSNRRAVGYGHTDFAPIVDALYDMDYDGYLSAEVFAYPDSLGAAEQTKLAFDWYFGQGV